MSRFLVLNFQDFGLDHHNITETIKSHTLFCICCLEKNVPFLNLSNCSHGKYLDHFSKPDLRSFKEVVCHRCHHELMKIEIFRKQVSASFQFLETEAHNINNTKNVRTLPNLEIKEAINISVPPPKKRVASSLISEADSTGKLKNQLKHVVPKRLTIHDLKIKQSEESEETQDLKIRATECDSLVSVEVPVTQVVIKSVDEVSNEKENFASVKIKKEPGCMIDVKSEVVEAVNQYDNDITISETEITPKALSKVNIETVTLTKEELGAERLSLARDEAYRRQPHRCEKCLLGFRFRENLHDHEERKHKPIEGSATCEICLQVVPPSVTLQAHLNRHYIRYQCQVCGSRYPVLQEALKHYRKSHLVQSDLFKCLHCNFTTSTNQLLSLHKARHKRFACRDCGLMLTTYASLKRHMRCTHMKSLNTCRVCALPFDSEAAFVSHMRSHGPEARCGPCGLPFRSWHAYSAHLATSAAHRHADRYKCSSCSLTYSSAAYLRLHCVMRRHHPHSPLYKCPQCPKLFAVPAEVKQHVHKVHSARHPSIVCDHCGKAYKTRVHLITHMKEVHSLKKSVKKRARTKNAV